MIIYNNVKYYVEGGEGLPLHHISRTADAVRYFITADSGFGFNAHGVPFKFVRLENGRLWYQITLDEDKETFKTQYTKERRKNWASSCVC